jgi:hypothetical protein
MTEQQNCKRCKKPIPVTLFDEYGVCIYCRMKEQAGLGA